METRVDETSRALVGTEEALVLGFHLDESAAEFELVCEFWGKHPKADRAFALFRFRGVQQLERGPGSHEELRKVGTTFVARAVRGAWVIHSARIEKDDKLRFASLSLGDSFGNIEFRYEVATHEVVHLYAKPKAPNNWDYFEVGTGRAVDFYNPFGRPWASIK